MSRENRLEHELVKIRALLVAQGDRECLGIGYPAIENECPPWPILDEVVHNITQVLKLESAQ
jgi:hypothetical protein